LIKNLKTWRSLMPINITMTSFSDRLAQRDDYVMPTEIRPDPLAQAQSIIQRPTATTIEPSKEVMFDPEGSGYDMESAKSVDMKPEIDPEDGLPHYGSVIETTKEQQEQYGLPEESYMLLKGKTHETWDKAVQGEEDRGFKIEKHGDRYYSVPDVTTTQGVDLSEEPIQSKTIYDDRDVATDDGKVTEALPNEEQVSTYTETDMREEDRSLVNEAYKNLLTAEGISGDTTGAAKTRKRGLTDEQYKRQVARLNNPNLTDKEASIAYLEELYVTFNNDLKGFSELDYQVKSDILHEAYNLGEDIKNFKKFSNAVKDNNVEQIFFNLLDTANISGKSSKGIAVRRAKLYNKHSSEKITEVEQLKDGTIIYKSKDKELFKYKPTKGKDKSSDPGKVNL
jgi:hypothetical protein